MSLTEVLCRPHMKSWWTTWSAIRTKVVSPLDTSSIEIFLHERLLFQLMFDHMLRCRVLWVLDHIQYFRRSNAVSCELFRFVALFGEVEDMIFVAVYSILLSKFKRSLIDTRTTIFVPDVDWIWNVRTELRTGGV